MLRHIGKIVQANNAAASLVLGPLGPSSAIRISEHGGENGFVKITQEGTTVTATNGSYIDGGTVITMIPEERPNAIQILSATSADPVVLTVAQRGEGGGNSPGGGGVNHPFAVGDQISVVDADVAAWNTLLTNVNVSAVGSTTITLGAVDGSSTATFTGDATARSCYSISHINETAGSNSKIYVEEIILGQTGI